MGRMVSLTLPAIEYIISPARAVNPRANTDQARNLAISPSPARYPRTYMRILEILPRLTAIAALIVWGLTLLRLVAPSTLSEIITIGLAALFVVLAQTQVMRFSSLLLWLSGGIWSGVAYHSTEVIGLAYFVVAVLTLGSAAYIEHDRGKFSISGPAAFIAAMMIVLVAANILSG